MNLLRRKFLHLAAGAAALPAVPCVARAQTYPTRPITIIVPFVPGGSTDAIGRILAQRLRSSLGQPVIIENVGGAGGTIGVGRVARAAPDGYTIDIGQTSTHVVNGAAYSLEYDLLKDFEPVSLVSSNPLLILAKKAMPADNLKELVVWLKANPDKATQGIPGPDQQAVGLLFQKATGTQFQFVPYRGGAQIMQDIVAGHIDLIITQAALALPQVRARAVKAYAVMAKARMPAAPDIPTVDEAGVPGLYASGWFGVFAPKGTPKAVISTLNAAIVEALADPMVRSRFADIGQDIFPREQQTPEALAALQKTEIEKWWPIIKAANLKGQ
jgi:tripartite-type tricarboxylate transporter receptor subunit TctC